jgi:uncharacterized protein
LQYHLILTDECNLCCSYCRGKLFDIPAAGEPGLDVDESVPPDIAVDPDLLGAFFGKDPGCAITFYGGEPLLRADRIREIMRRFPDGRYLLHTNGILLDRLEPELLNRIDTIHISIDGPRALTDRNRGGGTFDTIMHNLRECVAGGYKGEIIARMTVTEDCDIAAAVEYLAWNDEFPFSSIHWQMDANFWHDYPHRPYARWVAKSYNPGIRRLVARWVDTMQNSGEVMRWYPFVGTMADLLAGTPSPLRCGAGHAGYAIMTDGTIIPCPCMVGIREYYLGHVATADPSSLSAVHVPGPCDGCDLYEFCGGRCLYAAVTRPWPEEGRRCVCTTVRTLHDALQAVLPDVRELIRSGIIAPDAFAFSRYNGCEIIP